MATFNKTEIDAEKIRKGVQWNDQKLNWFMKKLFCIRQIVRTFQLPQQYNTI